MDGQERQWVLTWLICVLGAVAVLVAIAYGITVSSIANYADHMNSVNACHADRECIEIVTQGYPSGYHQVIVQSTTVQRP